MTSHINIDEVNWKRLFHAYGLATDTPMHLHNLLCSDFKRRDIALNHLFSATLHQGTIYSVTPIVVKVLIGILDAPALREDMYNFYYKRNKVNLERTKAKLNNPNTRSGLDKMLYHRQLALEIQLATVKTTTALETILTFIGLVAKSLFHCEKPDKIEIPCQKELDAFFDNVNEDDDSFWTSPLLDVLTKQAIWDLFTISHDVYEKILPYSSDINTDIKKQAIFATEKWSTITAKFPQANGGILC